MEIPYRIGNIELRLSKTLSWKGKESKSYYDIVYYYPNSYYGKESEYILDPVKKMYCNFKYPNCFIDPECFKHKESCYSIAHLIPDKNFEEEHDIQSVGSRPFNLNSKDIKDYLKVVKYSYEHWEELYKDDTNNYLM